MVVKLPQTEPWQREVLEYFAAHPKNKWIITKSPRQVGKSALLAVILIYASLKEEHSWSLCVSPVFSQARKLYDDVNVMSGRLVQKANGTALEIKFINGSVIKFGSAEQGDSLRGYTTKKSGVLCVDEFAFIKDKFFYDILVPITNVHHNNIFLFSTPKFKQGAFYDLYTRAIDADETSNLKCFDWTKYDLSKYLTEEILELYRKQLPKLTFLAEYKAEFISGEGSVFPSFKQCIGNYELDTDNELYISVDWGTGSGNDDTAITIGQQVGDMIGIASTIQFNDKTPTGTIEYIEGLVKDYIDKGFKTINITVEKNSIGAVYYSMLIESMDKVETNHNDMSAFNDAIEINCSTFVTTNQSKKRTVEQLELLFEQNRIILPNDTKLITQLSLFEAKINPLGTVYYQGTGTSHDDTVLSLLFMIDKLYNQIN